MLLGLETRARARALRISLCLYLVLVLIECTILRDLNGARPSPCVLLAHSLLPYAAAAQFIQYTAGKAEAASESKKLPSSSSQIKCLKRRIQKTFVSESK